jgi:hypothetical protein
MRYLGSGLVKEIGPAMVGWIIDAFGQVTFDVIDDRVERLAEVTVIVPVRAVEQGLMVVLDARGDQSTRGPLAPMQSAVDGQVP